jgi:hypothetical protein
MDQLYTWWTSHSRSATTATLRFARHDSRQVSVPAASAVVREENADAPAAQQLP